MKFENFQRWGGGDDPLSRAKREAEELAWWDRRSADKAAVDGGGKELERARAKERRRRRRRAGCTTRAARSRAAKTSPPKRPLRDEPWRLTRRGPAQIECCHLYFFYFLIFLLFSLSFYFSLFIFHLCSWTWKNTWFFIKISWIWWNSDFRNFVKLRNVRELENNVWIKKMSVSMKNVQEFLKCTRFF
jgi:hypothetical protein